MGCIQPESESRVSGIGPWDGPLGLEAEEQGGRRLLSG